MLYLDKLGSKEKKTSFLRITFTSDTNKPEDDEVQAINKIPKSTNVRDF